MAASITTENTLAGINKAVPQGNLVDLCADLNGVEELAWKISGLKTEALEREAAVLKAILDRVTPLVPVLSRDFESYYRSVLVILTEREEVQLEKSLKFYSEYKLVLYENGLLVRIHRYSEFSDSPRPGWELTNEEEFTPQAAIIAFGLPAIAKGLIRAFEWANSAIILKEELEANLKTLTTALEVISI